MSEPFVLGEKQPAEAYYVTFNFKQLLGEADIASAGVTAIDTADDSDVTSTVTDVSAQVETEKCVEVWVRAGANGSTYKVTVVVTADDGSVYELDALLPVVSL